MKTRETQQKQGFSISSPSRTRTYDLRIRNQVGTQEKQGDSDDPQQFRQQLESTDSKNIEFSDHRLSRLVILFSSATDDQQNAILVEAESIFVNAPKSRKKRSEAKPVQSLDQDT